MTPDQFLHRCKSVWHVGPPGSWAQIQKSGFKTAQQLIETADLPDEDRARLLAEARPEAVKLNVDGEEVVLRDQGTLLARDDLTGILHEDLTLTDWVGLLNKRVFFFCDERQKETLLKKYIEQDGAQEVLTLSPMRLLDAVRWQMELTAQNSGTLARKTGSVKSRETFVSVGQFLDKKPAEITVVDGIVDASPLVVRVERRHADGTVETLHPVPRH